MQKQEKLIEELESIESFANMLLEKCYSVKQLLSLGGFNPRATSKKKSQSKINQVIANRNRNITRKAKKILFALLILTNSVTAQTFDLPDIDSLYDCVEDYYDNLTEAETNEFKQSTKGHWLNYLPSPGYSPFTGGFTFSLNLSAPIQEARLRQASKNKIASIIRLNKLAAQSLKNEVFTDFEALENSINEFNLGDTLVFLKIKAFNLFKTQYERNEITPSDYLAKEYEIQQIQTARIIQRNNIYKSLLLLLLKSKKPMQTNAPAFKFN